MQFVDDRFGPGPPGVRIEFLQSDRVDDFARLADIIGLKD